MEEDEMMRYLYEREELIKVALEIYENKLVVGTWGNVSMRISNTKHLLITPSGMDYREIKPADIVLLNMEGEVLEGKWKPSSETPMHVAIYKNRADVGAIVHVHSTFASVFAVLHQSIPVILEETAQVIGHKIETAPYASCGTQELADCTASALGADKKAVLMANHGLLGVGRNLKDALRVCYIAEKTAMITVYAQNLGDIKELPEEDINLLNKKFAYYGKRQ
jgi:L-fuculose-phosphate aldolase